jgi:HAD superfamily hydrolase (TIGR01549 family)
VIRAVLIDLDDTLVDHQFAIREALRHLHQTDRRLQSLEYDWLVVEWQRLLEAMHDDVALGRVPIHESRIRRYKYFYERVGSPLGDDEVRGIADRHVAKYMSTRRVVPGAIELMRALRSHAPVAIVTNNTVVEQTEKLATFGLAPFVDHLVTSEEVGAAKPEPAIFEDALARLGVGAADAVMIGDSWENDVVGATNLGIRAVWLNRHGIECPDASLAHELASLEPSSEVVAAILSGGVRVR